MLKTKIICTLGPTASTADTIRELARAGMNGARFNMSHGTHEGHLKVFKQLDVVRQELGLPIATIIDTKGPEIRIRDFASGEVELRAGESFTLTTREVIGNEHIVSVSYPQLPKDLESKSRILLDDGRIELSIETMTKTDVGCRVVTGGQLSSRKGINLPGTPISMPYISPQDREDILFAIRTGFDIVAASFVRTKQDMLELRELLDTNGGAHMCIMAKIENPDGVRNIKEIIEVADAIMVARGDLGVEIALEDVPIIQKSLINQGRLAGCQVVVATQMLESMVNNSRPTRAEATDVANAIYEGTSGIMLSGETANGKYPVQAVQTMARIAARAEKDIDYQKRFMEYPASNSIRSVTDAISHATCLIAYNLKATAIITITQSGMTARMISRFRPNIPIIACTPLQSTQRALSLSWGVKPILMEHQTETDKLLEQAIGAAKAAGKVKDGDLVVLTAGVPPGIAGTTNLVRVVKVGEP